MKIMDSNRIRRPVGRYQDCITLSNIGEVGCPLAGRFIWRSRQFSGRHGPDETAHNRQRKPPASRL